MLTLAMSEVVFDALLMAAQEPNEQAFVGEVRTVFDSSNTTLLLRRLISIPPESYAEQGPHALRIRSEGFMPLFGDIERAKSAIAFVHTHPGGGADPSDLDLQVDDELAHIAHLRTGLPFVSIVVGGDSTASISARVAFVGGDVRSVDRVRVVGHRIRLWPRATERVVDQVFDRQVLAFGREGQSVLRSLRVGVVGLGGTGSAVVEQLARLGVGELVIVDPDHLEPSNISRVFGSATGDVGRQKTQIAAQNVARIGLGTKLETIDGRVTELDVAQHLRTCDIIFGCTDDQAGRAVLARLAYWYLIPVFDLGLSIQVTEGRIGDITGRVTYLAPGSPCLICRNRISPDAIAAESMSDNERRSRALEGYVPALPEPSPAVVALTSLVASTGVTDMLSRLFGLSSTWPSELLLRIDRHELRPNTADPVPGHYCDDPSTWGQGDGEPPLGLVWPTRRRVGPDGPAP